MLEQKALREKTEEIRKKLEKRGDLTAMGFDKVVLLATQRRDTIIKRDQTKAEQNKHRPPKGCGAYWQRRNNAWES